MADQEDLNVDQPEIASSDYELFRVKLSYVEGRPIELGVNEAFLLDDPDSVWFVHSGHVDIFFVETRSGEPAGSRNFLFRAREGDLLFGIDHTSADLGILASNLPGAQIIKLTRDRLAKIADDPDFTDFVFALVNRWVTLIAAGLTSGINTPKAHSRLRAGETSELEANDVARPASREVLWIKLQNGASARFMGRNEAVIKAADDWFPISGLTWIETTEPCQIEVQDTPTVITQPDGWEQIAGLHAFLLDYLHLLQAAREAAEREQLSAQSLSDQTRLENTFRGIAATLGTDDTEAIVVDQTDDPLMVVCQLVAEKKGITISRPPDTEANNFKEKGYRLRDIAAVSNLRVRQIALRGDWWTRDNGPLIAYTHEEQRPLALLPTSLRSYDVFDPQTGERKPVDEKVVEDMYYFGHVLYRPFPNKLLNALDLLKFGLEQVRGELRTVILLGSLVGILQIFVPIVTAFIFDEYIPRGDIGQLLQIGLVLIAITISAGLLQMALLFAFLRVETRIDADIQTAVWDRLLNLPTKFFREYTAGDLGSRAMGVSIIRRTLSASVTNSIIAGIFSVFNLALLFYYSPPLAFVAMILVFIAVAVTCFLGYLQVKRQRTVTRMQGQLSGYLLQFINGIVKFRVAGVENRVFAYWADKFREQRRAGYEAISIQNRLFVFAQVFPIVSLMTIFAMIAFSSSIDLSVGVFLAFNVAFTQFLVAGLDLSVAFIIVLAMVPIYERMKPIIQTEPEIEEALIPPGDLSGEIEVTNASFRYAEDGPLILDNVSLKINPGEFIAVVGPSGSGKSTLFRLLLGFERLSSGTILYDGQDLDKLDVRAVRRQIGVVLQNGQLMSGSDIFTNIIGANPLTMDDAWDAARMAGFEDDINQMPMGMYTVVSEGGSTLSGGQRQRLMIARAIVTKPRILLFDEATSALDNRTQAIVSESLEKLEATRIVIAHRLSTIMNADRIIVMSHGEIVEEGTYDDLIELGGTFSGLAKRQLI